MSRPTVRLGVHEMWTLLNNVDLVGAIRDGLHHPELWPGELTTIESGMLRFHDRDGDLTGELPAEDLRALRTAGLAAFAAHTLLVPGVVTAGVMGPRAAVQWHVGVLGQCVPNISHTAVFTADHGGVGPRVLDLLDLSGIGLSLATSPREAVLGATLVVALDGAGGGLRHEQLTRGSVLVTTDARLLSNDLRDGVDRRYAVEDLLGVQFDERPGRSEWNEILLVDLSDQGRCRELDVVLAHRLIQSASRLGIGTTTRNGATS